MRVCLDLILIMILTMGEGAQIMIFDFGQEE